MSPANPVAPLARSTVLYLAVKGLVRALLSVCCRVRYCGQDKVPQHGSLILVANHESFLDPFLIGAGLRRRPRYLVYHTYYRNPILGPPIYLVGGLPVGDGSPAATLAAAETLLRAGQVLEVFPEGERSPPGLVRPFQRGFVRLARVTGASILPVAIVGAGGIWPRHRTWPRPGKVDVIFGRPLAPPESGGDRRRLRQLEREFAERVRKAVIDLATGRLAPSQ